MTMSSMIERASRRGRRRARRPGVPDVRADRRMRRMAAARLARSYPGVWEMGVGEPREDVGRRAPAGTSSVAGPPLPVNELAAARSPGREPGCDGARLVGALLTEGHGLARRDSRRSLYPQRQP